jgi:hypothetical protein
MDNGNASISVTVNYQDRVEEHDFLPNIAISEVLDWFIQTFGIDPSIATELDLTPEGSDEAIPEHNHLGSVAQGEKTLFLNLVRGDIANGWL